MRRTECERETAGRAVLLLSCLLLAAPPALADEPAAVALFADRATPIAERLPDPTDLWVKPDLLPAINGFELKPEGACLDELCVPIDQGRDSELFLRRGGETWISVTGLANRLDQAWVADYERAVWSFGPVPAARSSFLEAAMAPDFALPDRSGRLVRLSDLRGKKVLLLTWASW
jgi:hypothetical protein